MLSRVASLLTLLGAASGLAFAHSAPNSFVKLAFGAHAVTAEVLVPESELAIATAAEHAGEPVASYLARHLAAETPHGARWTMRVSSVRDVTYLEHAYLSVEVELTPPTGATTGDFVLVDDAVTHEIRNHVVIVLARGDHPKFLGALQYPARRLAIQNSH